MKVQWETTDLRRGRRVWRDMECMLCSEDSGETARRWSLIVLSTGRMMTYGVSTEMVAYLNTWEYRPVAEK